MPDHTGMAAQPAQSLDARRPAGRWLAEYRAAAPAGDVVGDDPAWAMMLDELAAVASGDLGHARERVRRHAADPGTGHPADGHRSSLSPVPLLVAAREWDAIAAGVIQRAGLLELVLADLYGRQALVRDGRLPAAIPAGSAAWLPQLVGTTPAGGRHLHVVAIDLARAPGGEWRVVADHLRSPAGVGDALENRLAVSRTLGGLGERLNVRRHAPFFTSLRAGLAARCRRVDPRIGLLTPGRYSPSYPEQAHLARYLGFLLVEGADLAALDGQLYVRTIAGLKRIDALWRRIDARLLDPLAFDTRSRIGVPGLVDAWAAGNLLLANAPGVGVLEATAMAAFLPALAEPLTGAPLLLPDLATWWCGQPREAAFVAGALDRLVIAPAFDDPPLGLPGGETVGASLGARARAALLADFARRPQDYVGQERVARSTMPVVEGDALVPRPFTLRVFAARGADDRWTVLPGGLARGDGWSADVVVHGPDRQAPVSLLPSPDTLAIRRNPGTLPSRVADDCFWLGRYLERGEALLGTIRLLLGHGIDADGGAVLAPATVERLVGLITDAGAAPPPAGWSRPALTALARTAMEDAARPSVLCLDAQARRIGEGMRDRLSADMSRLLEAPFPPQRGMLDRTGSLQRRYAAIAGLAAEHMVRTDAWRFLELGRRIERAGAATRAVRTFGLAGSEADDWSVLLDLADSQISYRQRYQTGIARVPVVDLVALDGGNPRALAFQLAAIEARLAELPVLSDDGMAEPQQARARALAGVIAAADAAGLDAATLDDVERRLFALSDALTRRYFLHGAEPLRAAGLTLA